MSQLAQRYVQRGLSRDHDPRSDIFALTEAIADVIEVVESRTKVKKWGDNAFATVRSRLRSQAQRSLTLRPTRMSRLPSSIHPDAAL